MISHIHLRINNILEYSGYYFKAKSISQNLIGADRNKGVAEFKPCELNPIRLTEEILLKVGFEKDHLGAFCMKGFKFIVRPVQYGNPHLLKGIDDRGYSFELSTDKAWESIIRVKYLHQLQNLYFELTGQELNTAGLI